MNQIKNVNEYIANAPKDLQSRLEELRKTIMSAIPDPEEKISYAMPSYHHNGRVVYFAYWEKHIGLYALSSEVRDQYKKELEGYEMSKGTI